MNKLQTQITEYIEPYMNKTLSEGCLIENEYKTFKIIKFQKPFSNIMNIETFHILETVDLDKREDNVPDYKILGHFDITAVLKYIHIKLHKFDEDALDWDTILVRWYKLNKEHSIPNKPLNLYSEQENESLLELLKKLNEK